MMEPSYDFIYGESGQAGSSKENQQQPLRQSQMRQSDAVHAGKQLTSAIHGYTTQPFSEPTVEDLRIQVRTLEYEAAQWKKDREVLVLRHQKELSDAEGRADAEASRAQVAASSERAAVSRYEALLREVKDERDRYTSEKTDLERKLRTTTGQRESLQEQLEEVQEGVEDRERDLNRKVYDITQRHDGLQKAHRQLREDLEAKAQALQRAQQKVSAQEEQLVELDSQVMQLRSASEDAGAVAVLKKELDDQVGRTHKLETTLDEQNTELIELRHFRQDRANVDSDLNVLKGRVKELEHIQTEAGAT